MNSRKRFYSFILFISILAFSYTELRCQNIEISGKISDKNSKESLQFVYVLNKRTQEVVLTNFVGLYSVNAKQKDTLILSLLGYTKKYIYLNNYKDSIKNNKLVLNLFLDPKSVDLKTVIVMPNEFSKEEKEYFERNIYTPEIRTLSPITALYNKFSSEAKEKEKLSVYYNERLREEKLRKRLPNELIRNITQDEKLDINEFLLFIKIPPQLIDNGSNYELYTEVKKWHTLYKMQQSGTSF